MTQSSSIEKTVRDGDNRKSIEVKKVENGYVINISKSWKEGDDYKYEDKTYISTKNPLESKEKEIELEDSIGNLMDEIKMM